MIEPIHIISLGAGVQSSTMALMAAAGEITPMPEFAVFADTQSEPKSVYVWLDWLEKHLPFPVRRVTAGNLAELSLAPKVSKKSLQTYLRHSVPVYTVNKDGSFGNMQRHCTQTTKLAPLYSAIRAGVVWIGISTDEALRMKDSQRRAITHRWPLIEKGMSRRACLQWLKENGFPKAPRSACSFCPYHNNTEWRRLKTEEPEAFADAIKYEADLQVAFKACSCLTSTPFLHASRKPLSEVDFSTEEERGQINMFNNECEGMCGV
jgi:hypothetical protein